VILDTLSAGIGEQRLKKRQWIPPPHLHPPHLKTELSLKDLAGDGRNLEERKY
jgi:hypothetical protein